MLHDHFCNPPGCTAWMKPPTHTHTLFTCLALKAVQQRAMVPTAHQRPPGVAGKLNHAVVPLSTAHALHAPTAPAVHQRMGAWAINMHGVVSWSHRCGAWIRCA